MEKNVKIKIAVNEKFDSLYKLGYFLVELNSICNFSVLLNEQSKELDKLYKNKTFDITSRDFNQSSHNNIKLKNFSQGSFVALIVAPVIVGVILMIIEKYTNKKNGKKHGDTINIFINNVQIIKNVNITFNEKLPPEENINNIVTVLKEKKLIDKNGIIYNKEGKKILINQINKLNEHLIDQYS